MPVLIAAVVLVGAIAVLNLLLTMAVIRRLRRYEAAQGAPLPDSGPKVGATIPEFSGETLSGETVATTDVSSAEAVFAFLSTTCSACPTSLPYLVEYAQARELKAAQVVAVIGGEQADAGEFLDALAGKATVIMEAAMGPITQSFDVSAFPTFVMTNAEATVTRTVSGSQPLIQD